jgi:hypothetical protein
MMTGNLSATDMEGAPGGIDDPQHLHTSRQDA